MQQMHSLQCIIELWGCQENAHGSETTWAVIMLHEKSVTETKEGVKRTEVVVKSILTNDFEELARNGGSYIFSPPSPEGGHTPRYPLHVIFAPNNHAHKLAIIWSKLI